MEDHGCPVDDHCSPADDHVENHDHVWSGHVAQVDRFWRFTQCIRQFGTVTHIVTLTHIFPTNRQLKIRPFKNPTWSWQSKNLDMSLKVWPIDTTY